MAHGIGAIKAGGLAPFAERFCRASFAAVVFDYRESCRSSGKGPGADLTAHSYLCSLPMGSQNRTPGSA
jgi:hypothetical protein